MFNFIITSNSNYICEFFIDGENLGNLEMRWTMLETVNYTKSNNRKG